MTFSRFRGGLGFILIAAFLLLAQFFPESNKFDISKELDIWIYLGLLMPVLVILLVKRKREIAVLDTFSLFGFLIFSLVSFYFSKTANYGFSELYMLTVAVIFYLTLAHQKNEQRRFLYLSLILLALINAVAGFLRYFGQSEAEMAGLFFDRDFKPYFYPNAFALLMLMSWPLLLNEILKKAGLLKILALALLLLALVFSFSRGSYLSLAVQLLIISSYLARDVFMKSGRKMIIFGLIVAFLFGVMQFKDGRDLSKTVVAQVDGFSEFDYLTSYNERYDFWQGSVKLWVEKPWFGWGPASFRYVYPRVQEILLANSDHPHNYVLKVLVENGLFAFLFMAVFFMTVAGNGLKRFRKLPFREKNEAVCLATALIGGFLHNLMDFNLNFVTNFVFFWVLLAVFRSLFVKEEVKFPNRHFIALSMLIVLVFATGYRERDLFLNYAKKGQQAALTSDDEQAQKYFEAYKRAYFPRDYFLEQARFYKVKISPTEVQKGLDAIKFQLLLNPEDARGWDMQGEILRYLDPGFWLGEFHDFSRAVKLDPKNNFIYYYHLGEVLARRAELRDRLPAWRDQVLTVLEDYEFFVQNNIHFTAKTAQPEFAVLIYELLSNEFSAERDFYQGKIELIRAAQI